MTKLRKPAGVIQAQNAKHQVRVSWSLFGERGCLIRAVLLAPNSEELDEHSGGVAPVEVKSSKPCTSELVISTWTELKSRIADKSSALFLSLSESFDEMESKLQNL